MSVDFVIKLRDAAALVLDVCTEELERLAPVEVRAINLEKIQWDKASGEHGEYERSDDINNAEYKRLLQVLGEHKGKMQVGEFFVWAFQNQSTIGKKKRR